MNIKKRIKILVARMLDMYDGINPMLMKDFYKAVHSEMLPEGMTQSVSYYTPRRSRVERWPKVVNYGLQAFIKTWLIEAFNRDFFYQKESKVVNSYKRIIDNAMGEGIYDIEKIRKLHQLGYLPIEIVAVPEGLEVPMRVPIFGITNTHPDFAWLPQALESLISAEVWYPMICATVAHDARQIVNKYWGLTCDDDMPRRRALGNFDFRGDQGADAALKAAGGWLLSFVNTATVPAIPYMERNYNCDCTKDEVGFGAISTEHFVMCSNFAVDGNEKDFYLRLLNDLYPNNSFSAVCDSYDYWNVVENILPEIKEDILRHNGTMIIRGDSGDDPCDVVTKTVFKLWDTFGGTVNKKGYKVLNTHVKAIYGDSITLDRLELIYQILMDNGFAACNVSLGFGSFSMHCIHEDGMFKPFTRDTFSSAIKACWAVINGKPYNIYKDPKTDRDSKNPFKKSHKGCVRVFYDADGNMVCEDELTYEESLKNSLMRVIFRDGEMIEDESLDTIRQRLNNGEF